MYSTIRNILELIAIRRNICRSGEHASDTLLGTTPYDTAVLKSRNRDYPHEGRLVFENRARRSGAFGEKHSDMKYVRHASEKF